jgi:hypothetical protein
VALLARWFGSTVTAGKDNPAPVDFIPLDEATAQTTLASLQQSD